MRASTVAAIFCLTAGVAPSIATPSMRSEHVVRTTNPTHKAFGYELVKASVVALTAIGISTMYDIYGTTKSSRRELLERFDERINQELAAREYKRELLAAPLDNLD